LDLLFNSTDSSEHGDARGKLYKIKTDGTNKTKITDEYASYVNVSGDWIYYSNLNETERVLELYKIKTDGTNRTKINNDKVSFCVVGNTKVLPHKFSTAY
jgi:hypothetical protein